MNEMATEEETVKIVENYMKHSGFKDFKIINLFDKIYKWRVDLEASSDKYVIEISKSEKIVLKFEKT